MPHPMEYTPTARDFMAAALRELEWGDKHELASEQLSAIPGREAGAATYASFAKNARANAKSLLRKALDMP